MYSKTNCYFRDNQMNEQKFLQLSVNQQNALVCEKGVLLISFEKGDTSISFHRLNHLFVKTISRKDGYRLIEVHTSQKIFEFAEFSND